MRASDTSCPLCAGSDCCNHSTVNARCYWHCRQCQLIFVDPSDYLTPAEEKAQYDLHQNSPDDPRYRRFLAQLYNPMLPLLQPHSKGLDFGSGPGPTLSVMFEEAGHTMVIYDSFYAPDNTALQQHYDFITATEVIEHLQQPGQVLDSLWKLLQPGGHLGVMTQLWDQQPDFAQWSYKDDPTHISLFSTHTLGWLAQRWDAGLLRLNRNASVFVKSAETS